MSFETAIHQWREGERRLDEAVGPQRPALERVTDAIHRELRRRLGGAFSTDELADLYDAGTDWPKDLYARLGFDPVGRAWAFTRPGPEHPAHVPQ